MSTLALSEAQGRTLAPTPFGMNPVIAARLRSFGVDPTAYAQKIAVTHHQSRPAPLHRLERVALSAHAMGLGRGLNVMQLALDPNDVRVAPLLNQAALAYEDNQYVADIVAPVQLVTERSAKYKLWNRAEYRALIDTRIGPNGSAKEVSPSLSEDNYSVVRRALKAFANNDTDLANPSLGARAAAVEQVMEIHTLNREADVAAQFNTSGNYASGNVKTLTTGGGGTNWSQGSGANPVADILAMQEKIPGPVTHAVMTDVVWHAIQQNTQMKSILASQINNQGILRPMDFGLYFGIPNILITNADYRDDTGARKRIWSETNLWLGSVNPGRDRRTFARTFRLRQGAQGWVTKTWRDEDRGANGGDWVRTAYEEDRKIVSNDYGALIVNVVG